MKKIYNKLIRDKIPEIIELTGKKCNVQVLHPSEFEEELNKKLDEVVREYLTSEDLEKLADVLEILYVLVEHHGCTMEDLEEIRFTKKEQRGSFSKKLLLQSISDTEEE